MAMHGGLNLQHSDLQDFLFAPIWNEESGIPLSILSALARLGMDPWKEAARLSDMPRVGAASALATILARLPSGDQEHPDYDKLSRDLVRFLPEGGSKPSTDGPGKGRMESGIMSAGIQTLGLIIALVLALIVLQVSGWLF